MPKADNGDVEDFSKLVDLHYAKVYYHCIKMMKNDHDAADVTQNTFTNAFININRLKNNDSFGAWIFTICNNEIRMFYRKSKNAEIPHTAPRAEQSYKTFKGFHRRRSGSVGATKGSCFVLVTSIEKLREKIINNGWNKVTEIRDNGWGTKGFNVEDLNGFVLEFCEWT